MVTPLIAAIALAALLAAPGVPRIYDPHGVILVGALTTGLGYASEALFVVPLMLVIPSLRRPSWGTAPLWGALVATVAVIATFRNLAWLVFLLVPKFGVAGAIGGWAYHLMVERQCRGTLEDVTSSRVG